MKRKHILILDWLVLLGCTYLTLYGLSKVHVFSHIINDSISTLSVLVSLCLYYVYQITLDRRVVYIPYVGFIPVTLGQSTLRWSLERFYVGTEFVWKERELKDITHRMMLSLEYFGSNISDTQAIGMGILLTMGVMTMGSIKTINALMEELQTRGLKEKEIETIGTT